jgi:hypothetical protein
VGRLRPATPRSALPGTLNTTEQPSPTPQARDNAGLRHDPRAHRLAATRVSPPMADEAQPGCRASVSQYVDCAIKSRSAGKANVARDQLGVEQLSEHDVARVVHRDVLP